MRPKVCTNKSSTGESRSQILMSELSCVNQTTQMANTALLKCMRSSTKEATKRIFRSNRTPLQKKLEKKVEWGTSRNVPRREFRTLYHTDVTTLEHLEE